MMKIVSDESPSKPATQVGSFSLSDGPTKNAAYMMDLLTTREKVAVTPEWVQAMALVGIAQSLDQIAKMLARAEEGPW